MVGNKLTHFQGKIFSKSIFSPETWMKKKERGFWKNLIWFLLSKPVPPGDKKTQVNPDLELSSRSNSSWWKIFCFSLNRAPMVWANLLSFWVSFLAVWAIYCQFGQVLFTDKRLWSFLSNVSFPTSKWWLCFGLILSDYFEKTLSKCILIFLGQLWQVCLNTYSVWCLSCFVQGRKWQNTGSPLSVSQPWLWIPVKLIIW